MVNPNDIQDGVAYARFGAFLLNDNPIDQETGTYVDVPVPVDVAKLVEAGVNLEDPDPYRNPAGNIYFNASIHTPAETAEQADPTDISPIPHMSAAGIAAWEGRA